MHMSYPSVKREWDWSKCVWLCVCECVCECRGRFHQHFRAIFSRAKFDAFFGERRLVNGAQIWQIFCLKFGFTVLELTVGEIEQRIFRQTPFAGNFSLGEKVWWNRPQVCVWLCVPAYFSSTLKVHWNNELTVIVKVWIFEIRDPFFSLWRNIF